VRIPLFGELSFVVIALHKSRPCGRPQIGVVSVVQYWKQFVLWATILLAVVGVIVAFTNLPVITGCGYYARCGASAVTG
jgi:hypothetical protein